MSNQSARLGAVIATGERIACTTGEAADDDQRDQDGGQAMGHQFAANDQNRTEIEMRMRRIPYAVNIIDATRKL